MADYQQNFLSSLAGGLQVGQQIKQQRDTSQINRLAGLAYGADPGQRESLIGQMHQINPQMAAEQEKGMAMTDERRQKGLINAARILVNTPEQFRAGQYARMVPGLSQYGLSSLPPEYNAETSDLIMQTAQGLVSAADGAGAASDLKSFNAYTQGLSPEDVSKARRIKLGLDPRAVTGAMRFDTFTDANGNPRPQRNNPTTGQVEIYVDETGQWQPLGGGQPAQAPPQPGTYGTPSGMVRIGDLTPEQWASAKADIESGGTLENVTLPARNVSPAQFSATGLGVGRRKEDEARAIEQAKTDVQLRNLPTELGMRTDAAVRQASGIEQAKTQAERAAQAPKRIRQYEQAIGAAGSVMTSLDNAIKLIGPTTTGWGGARLRGIEGTDSYNLAAEIETIKANLGFDRLQQMRDNSPTGGALGSIAVQELVALQSTVANLDPNQSAEQIKQNLERVKQHYEGWVSAVQQALVDERRGSQAQQPAPAPAGQGAAAPQRARNPQTGEVLELRNGQWVPAQ